MAFLKSNKGEKYKKTLRFAFLKDIIEKILYKSNYSNIPTGQLVYPPKYQPVWIRKSLILVWIRTIYQTHYLED